MKKLLGVLLIAALGSAHAINLKTAASYAVLHHPKVLAAEADAQSSLYALERAKGRMYPQVDVRLAAGRENSDTPFGRNSGFSNLILTRQENQINLSQLLFDGGRTRSEIRQQSFNLQSSDYQYMQETQSILLDTARTYLDVLRARELVRLSVDNVNVHNKILSFVDMRYHGGAGTIGETQLAESRLALAQIRLNSAKGALQEANARYIAVVGQPAPVKMELPHSMAPYLPNRLSQAAKIALVNNPALNNSASQVRSSAEAVKAEKSRFMPRFNLEVGASDNENIDGIAGLNRDLSAMVTLNYNVFSGGQDLAALNQARSQNIQSRHEFNQARRQVIEIIATVWSNLQTNIKEYLRHRTYVEYLKLVVADYRLQFSLGKRALFNVLDEENELFRARVGLTDAYYNSKINTFELMANMGQLSPSVL